MQLLAYIAVGFFTGLLGRVILTNARRMSLIRFLLIGTLGGMFGGGLVGSLFVRQEPLTIGIPSLVGAFLGSVVAISVVVSLSRTRAHA